ncbi:hypothetical protein MW887_011439 [Aspergillus wentii]|nr:hypothetical protein MW887_011439 [Aspergillus wentii]
MASVLLNNNYASHSNDKATIILRTEKYTIPKKFKFSTDTCLIYAETIELTSDITAQGKSIGLFCHRLKLSSHVTIDVPGDKGAAGDNHSLPRENAFHNLEIKAYGGDGGNGGDSTSSQDDSKETRTGGAGGNGGNAGDIELLFGTADMDAARALVKVQKRPWPEPALCLTGPVLSYSLPGYLPEEQKQLLELLKSLSGVIQSLARQLKILSKAGDTKEIQAVASSLMQEAYTNLALKSKAPTNITIETVKFLQVVLDSIRSLNQRTPNLDATEILTDAKQAIVIVVPQEDSEMVSLTGHLENRLRQSAGGFGGIGSKNSASGKDGLKIGSNRAKDLHFEGTKRDVDVLQAHIFPEHCQMLLNKADDLFFSSNTEN